MDDELLRCDFCSTWIAPHDFIEGRAVVIFQKRYCPSCMVEAVRRSKAKKAAPAPPAAPPAPPPVVPPSAPDVAALPPPRATRRLRIGEHGCGLFGSEEERRAQLGPYLREGLENGERVIHFLRMPSPEKILGDFRSVGLSVQPYLQGGQLEILPASKLLGKSGEFVPVEMATRILQAADRAIEDGYARLRIAAEMTWALGDPIGIDRLIEFERELNALTARGKCTALCQYNIYRFETPALREIRANHPCVFVQGSAETVLRELAASGL